MKEVTWMLRKTTANYQYLILQAVPTSQNRKELQGHCYMYERNILTTEHPKSEFKTMQNMHNRIK
jgi:hypothetical protein